MKPEYDYIIVGSGVAGLSVAAAAAKNGRRSLIITKSHLEESNTRYAQGGIAAAVAPTDSPLSHLEDTLVAGAGLSEPQAVKALTTEAPKRIAELVRLGMPFDRETASGEIELGREGAHSANRILHAGGDATGKHLEHTLAQVVRQSEYIEKLEQHFVYELLQDGTRRVTGVKILDENSGSAPFEVYGRHVVLATGGAGQLYRYTTNPKLTTGDGMALAWRAGAALADMEFFQFHPTALNLPGAPSFLISEAMRGEGAVLRNAAGETFMANYDPRLELASRDIVARAIASELDKTGKVFLDIRHLGKDKLHHHFPSIYEFCLNYGLDISEDMIPVAPAAHYFMGGVLTGRWGETTLPGLYAVGEAAATGVHGANRLASNSLLEGLVFGQRLYDYTAQGEPGQLDLPAYRQTARIPLTEYSLPQPDPTFEEAGTVTLEGVQGLMWEKVGLARIAGGLTEAFSALDGWEKNPAILEGQDRAGLELANLVTVGRLVAGAALIREESRGAHYRLDFPTTREEWLRRIVLQKSL